MVARGIERLGRQHYRIWWTEAVSGRRRSRMVHVELGDVKVMRSGIIEAQSRGAYALAGCAAAGT